MNDMKIAEMTFRLRAPWVHSLKEKRMIENDTARLQNKFHMPTAEIDEQDIHQITEWNTIMCEAFCKREDGGRI